MAQINNYSWLDLIPTGWIELARKMIEECEAIDPNYEITDLKEKWGMLCTYSNSSNPATTEIEDKYEALSARICNICGKPATKVSTSWILPWCDECWVQYDEY